MLASFLFISRHKFRLLVVNISKKTLSISFDKTVRSSGINDNLAISDVAEFKKAIINLVLSAEKQIGEMIYDVVLSLDGCKYSYDSIEVKKTFSTQRKISSSDISQMKEASISQFIKDNKDSSELFETFWSEFIIDSSITSFKNPVGTLANNIVVKDIYSFFDKALFKNIVSVINECKINIIKTVTPDSLETHFQINQKTQNSQEPNLIINISDTHSTAVLIQNKTLVEFATIESGRSEILNSISTLFDLNSKTSNNLLELAIQMQNSNNQEYRASLAGEDAIDNQSIVKITKIASEAYHQIISSLIESIFQKTKILDKSVVSLNLVGIASYEIRSSEILRLKNINVNLKTSVNEVGLEREIKKDYQSFLVSFFEKNLRKQRINILPIISLLKIPFVRLK